MGPTAFAVRAECHARAASGGEIIIADVSMSLDNVLAAGAAVTAGLTAGGCHGRRRSVSHCMSSIRRRPPPACRSRQPRTALRTSRKSPKP